MKTTSLSVHSNQTTERRTENGEIAEITSEKEQKIIQIMQSISRVHTNPLYQLPSDSGLTGKGIDRLCREHTVTRRWVLDERALTSREEGSRGRHRGTDTLSSLWVRFAVPC